jgi:two-component system, response regulator
MEQPDIDGADESVPDPPYVLVVEDDPDDLALIMRSLRLAGVAAGVVHAFDGEDALHLLGLCDCHRGAALPDVVFLDMKLPKVDGLEVLRRIRRNRATEGLSVVVLTSLDDPDNHLSAVLLSASTYLVKPMDYEDFITQVSGLARRLLAHKVWPPVSEGN